MNMAITNAERISAARPIIESPDIIPVVVPGKVRPAPPFVGKAVTFAERKPGSTERHTGSTEPVKSLAVRKRRGANHVLFLGCGGGRMEVEGGGETIVGW